MKNLKGTIENKDIAIEILRRNGVAGYEAGVYEHYHDTDYPGLTISSTMIDLSVRDKSLEKRVYNVLVNVGFKDRSEK